MNVTSVRPSAPQGTNVKSHTRHFYISHNAPYLSHKILHRLRAVSYHLSYFSLQSYCTWNPSTRTAKPRTARNEWIVIITEITSWFAIALDEVRTRQILRGKADCKQSKFCTTFVFHFSWVLQPSEEKIIENNAYAKFWGQIRCVMGNVEVAYGSLLHIHVDPVVDSCCSQLTAVKTG